jgi:hypothetical protein
MIRKACPALDAGWAPVFDDTRGVTRRSNLSGGLAVRQNQADIRTHLIARPARETVGFCWSRWLHGCVLAIRSARTTAEQPTPKCRESSYSWFSRPRTCVRLVQRNRSTAGGTARSRLRRGTKYRDRISLGQECWRYVEMNVDIILAPASTQVAPARNATSRIPIIFAQHADPVGTGDVASLAHPGAPSVLT